MTSHTGTTSHAGLKWRARLEDALEEAKKNGKHVLVDFSAAPA
jgi:hypothetical protein